MDGGKDVKSPADFLWFGAWWLYGIV